MENGMMVAYFSTFLVTIFIPLTILIGLYVLKSIGLKEIADNRGLINSTYAWIPFLDLYLMTLMVDEFDVFGYEVTEVSRFTIIVAIVTMGLSIIPIMGLIVVFCGAIYFYFFFKEFFIPYTEVPSIYAVVSLLGFLPVLLFIHRKDVIE